MAAGLLCLARPTNAQSTPGAVLDFDGTNAYVDLGTSLHDDFGGNRITVEGWFYPTRVVEQQGLLSEYYHNDNNVMFTLVQTGNTVECSFFNGVWQRASGVALTLNTWQHIACAYDQQNIKLYRNGVMTASRANGTDFGDATIGNGRPTAMSTAIQ